MHVVTRSRGGEKRTYYYVGRYWWRVEYVGRSGRTSRVRWKYLGREKPREAEGLPDPPRNPLEGLRFYAVGEDVYLERSVYERYSWVFSGYPVEDCGEKGKPNRRVTGERSRG